MSDTPPSEEQERIQRQRVEAMVRHTARLLLLSPALTLSFCSHLLQLLGCPTGAPTVTLRWFPRALALTSHKLPSASTHARMGFPCAASQAKDFVGEMDYRMLIETIWQQFPEMNIPLRTERALVDPTADPSLPIRSNITELDPTVRRRERAFAFALRELERTARQRRTASTQTLTPHGVG